MAFKIFTLFLSLCVLSPSAWGQSFVETQPLFFGRIAIDNITDNVRVTIRNNGGFTVNANTFMIDPPTRGEYSLTGGPPNTVYSITTPASFNIIGPSGNFIVDNIRVRPNSLVTNASGEDDFRIAARLTSGSGTFFPDGTYSDTFDVTMNF